MKTPIKIVSIIVLIALWAFTIQKPLDKSIRKKVVQNEKILSPQPIVAAHSKDNTIKVALLLDTSGSMDGLIDQAKAQLWEIVNQLSFAKHGTKNPDLYIALYEYGNDNIEASDGFIRKIIDFSNDLDLISEKLFALTTNGGSEYCGAVIQTSLDDLEWGKKEDDLNLIFIAGNEAFTQGRVSYIDATDNANEKEVTVNTIFCGNYQNGISGKWKSGATRTNGEYFAIDHNQKQVYVVTPFDDIIIQLNVKLNKTYINYGRQGSRKMALQATQDSNAMAVNEEVAVKRAVSKSNRMYSNSSWDLVDAVKDKNFEYEEVKAETLPKELQGKTTAELKKYVEKQATERIAIQEQINTLNKQRIVYIAKQQAGNKVDNLENALISTIKTQAKLKNYSW